MASAPVVTPMRRQEDDVSWSEALCCRWRALGFAGEAPRPVTAASSPAVWEASGLLSTAPEWPSAGDMVVVRRGHAAHAGAAKERQWTSMTQCGSPQPAPPGRSCLEGRMCSATRDCGSNRGRGTARTSVHACGGRPAAAVAIADPPADDCDASTWVTTEVRTPATEVESGGGKARSSRLPSAWLSANPRDGNQRIRTQGGGTDVRPPRPLADKMCSPDATR
jgi:hypothetical protein